MKYAYYILLIFTLLLHPVCCNAYPGGESFKKAKALYEQGDYNSALSLYQQCIIENPEVYNSKGNYMIALCYKKMDRCSESIRYFKRAWVADSITGGASSAGKFIEQLEACNISKQKLLAFDENSTEVETATETELNNRVTPTENNEQTVSKDNNDESHEEKSNYTWLWITVGAIFILVIIYYVVKRNKARREDQETAETTNYRKNELLFRCSDILFSDAYWTPLYDRFGQEMVERKRQEWTEEYSRQSENPNQIAIESLTSDLEDFVKNPENHLF
jgi:tetratricopeptide (TPR) repeat protein